MNLRVTIKIDPKAVGQAFAYTDDEAQAQMLNEMAVELTACCGNKAEMQICAFSKQLNKHGIELIKKIKSFIDLRSEETTNGF